MIDDQDGSHRGSAGLTEAYLEASGGNETHRFRAMAGAFFLPTSRENVDALWESPYAITSSALNSWFGEELRPVGIDVSYTALRRLGSPGSPVVFDTRVMGEVRWYFTGR